VGQATGGIDVYPIAGAPKNICAGYGPRPKPDGTTALHDACDLCAPQGSPAVAVTDGVVSYGTDPFGGNVAILRTPDGSTGYYYAHLMDVQSGQRAVKTGEQIARVDTTGNAAKVGIPHVHLQIWPGGSFVQGTVHPDPTAALMAAPVLDAPVDTTSGSGWVAATIAALIGLGLGVGSYMLTERT
jgi:murein DD-endopeptidase MepM/ murein hydrolase activator NlpD